MKISAKLVKISLCFSILKLKTSGNLVLRQIQDKLRQICLSIVFGFPNMLLHKCYHKICQTSILTGVIVHYSIFFFVF